MRVINEKLSKLSTEMNQLGLEVTRVTGNSTDSEIDWDMSEHFPNIEQTFANWIKEINEILAYLKNANGYEGKSYLTSDISTALSNIEKLANDINKLPTRLTLLSSGSSCAAQYLSNQISSVTTSSVTFDKFYIHGSKAKLSKAKANGFKTMWVKTKRLLNSFVDQNYVSESKDALKVWTARSRQYCNVLQKMVDDDFTKKTGIKVDIELLADESKILLANAANEAPDVVTGVSTWIPNEYGMRGAILNLREFADYKDVIKSYTNEQLIPLTYDDKLFGIPETENFYVLFYRKDILENLNLSSFNTSNVTTMYSMFSELSISKLDLSNFDTSNVTAMASMFEKCTSLKNLNLSSFNTSKVIYMDFMFSNCNSIEDLNLSSFNTSKVTNMGNMFFNCYLLKKLDLSSFDTSNVTNMAGMFRDCSKLQYLNINSFDTSNVTGMNSMFRGCNNLTTLDLSNFNTSKVTNFSNMFRDCQKMKEINLSNFDTSIATTFANLFHNCSSLTTLDLSSFNTNKVTYMGSMFYNCSSLTSLDLSNFNTSNVINMGYGMFYNCKSLKELDLSNFDTKKVIDFSDMFNGCSSLENIELSSFDTTNATNMANMFYNCKSLKQLDLSSFNTSKVTNMSKMFLQNNEINTIYVSEKWNTSNVTSSSLMFHSCTSLVGAVPFDSSKTDISMANYTNGYLTYKSNN